jgi:adenylate kinase
MFREGVRKGTVYGSQAQEYMQRGVLVPDDIVLAMVMERLAAPDAQRAFVLDGFPRTLIQAQALDQALAAAGKHLDRALSIVVPRDVLVERLGGRWTCPNCQAIYHTVNHPPARPGVCDRCGGELSQRPDDRDEAVQKRLMVYLEETMPLVDYYRTQGLLREVDGNQPLQRVTADLQQALQRRQNLANV